MSEADSLKKKKELKIEILRTLTSMNCILSEIEKQIDSLRNDTKPGGKLAIGEEKVRESFPLVIDALGGQEDPS